MSILLAAAGTMAAAGVGEFIMTRGSSGDERGYNAGNRVGSSYGAMSPAELLGNDFESLYVDANPDASFDLLFVLAGTLTQDFIDTLSCSLGSFSGAAADFNATGGYSIWEWTDMGSTFPDSGTEKVVITR